MSKEFDEAIEFLTFSSLMPDNDESGRQGGCSSCFSIILGILVVVFMLFSCFTSVAKQRLEYNPVMDWYYWVDETESETYTHHDDDKESDKVEAEDSSSSKKQYKSDFDVNDEFIRNMKDIRTWQYRVIGAINVNGKIYYKNDDGTFHRGWKAEGGYWYYFDPSDLALVTNTLKEIDGKVYYFNEHGQMLSNIVIDIAGYKINIDANGWCQLVE